MTAVFSARRWTWVLVGMGLFASCTPEETPFVPDAAGPSDAAHTLDGSAVEQDAAALLLDAAMPPPPDSGMPPDPLDAGGPSDLDPDFTAQARAYFELHVRPVLLSQSNQCSSCHTSAYGSPRQINFMEVPGQPDMHSSVLAWRSGGVPLINVHEEEASMPSQSILFRRHVHGNSDILPDYPAEELPEAAVWVRLERNACRQRNDCPDPPDGGLDMDASVTLNPRETALAYFYAHVNPIITQKHCINCHGVPGPGPDLNINFLANYPADAPRTYDSILVFRLTAGVPRLFDFVQLEQSRILRRGAHAGAALAGNDGDRALVLTWLALERAAACSEGTWPCGGADAGPTPDASPQDAAPPPDSGSTTVGNPRESSRAFFNTNVLPVLQEQGCAECHAGGRGELFNVAYLDQSGPPYESVVDYLSTDFRNLYDISTPALSLMLTKGIHAGAAFGRYGQEQQDMQAFMDWVALEGAAQSTFIQDAGPRLMDAAVPPDAGRDAGRDAGGDGGVQTPRQIAEQYFQDTILPHLTQHSCHVCHSGEIGRTNVPPVNWMDLNGQDAYRSTLGWRTASGYPLLDLDDAPASLLLTKPRHYGGLAPGYVTPGDSTAIPQFVTWVELERAAATAEGTYTPPLPDAGPQGLDASPGMDAADAAVRLDAGPPQLADASVERAVAREFFFDHVYINLSTASRVDATCQGCHIQGQRPTPFMIRAGENSALAEERYQFIRTNGSLVNKSVPGASLLLIKDENHEGGQGLLRPASRELDRRAFLDWVELEKEADCTERWNCVPVEQPGPVCETQFLPEVAAANAPYPADNAVDVASRLCRSELAGTVLSFQARRLGSGVEFTNISILTPAGHALRVMRPFLTRWSRSTLPDGGISYFPQEILELQPGFDREVGPNGFLPILTQPGAIMGSFFGPAGLTSFMSLEFASLGPVEVVDAGLPTLDAGPAVLTPCKNVAQFVLQVAPQLGSRNLDGGGASCMSCHTGQVVAATSKMDLTGLASNPQAACAQVRQWVVPSNPASSTLLTNVDPAVQSSHLWYFSTTNPAEFRDFSAAVTPWIMAESP